MTVPSEEMQERSRLVMEALAAAIGRDTAGVDDAMNALAEKGWSALYGAVLAFGTAVQKVCQLEPADGQLMGVLVVNAATGERGSLEDIGLGPELEAAIRIFLAWGNGDTEMATGIFYDAVKRGAGHDVISAALAWASHLIRAELQRKEAECP
ncbi:hypothetical protein AB0O28_19180 [Microbispora sp. NPDC088329]|uniref:hypothetical protein n=1 Tax=Microbispora sp. NPDC088329 TaxID=3154869 RepID=UPI00341C3010